MNNEWISVKDRLPEKSGDYIVSIKAGSIRYTSSLPYSMKYKRWNVEDDDTRRKAKRYEISGVTHWMPWVDLPEITEDD